MEVVRLLLLTYLVFGISGRPVYLRQTEGNEVSKNQLLEDTTKLHHSDPKGQKTSPPVARHQHQHVIKKHHHHHLSKNEEIAILEKYFLQEHELLETMLNNFTNKFYANYNEKVPEVIHEFIYSTKKYLISIIALIILVMIILCICVSFIEDRIYKFSKKYL